MSYVDLNPIRAGMAESLEESAFTSIQQRLEERAQERYEDLPVSEGTGRRRPNLVGFAAHNHPRGEDDLPLALDVYVELLVATGAAVRSTVPCHPALPERAAATLERLGIRSELWLESLRGYQHRFFTMVGCVHAIAVCCARTDRRQAKGSAWAGEVFRNCA
jgi:hypothetical protein